MCRCGGASEHLHFGTETISYDASLHPYIDLKKCTLDACKSEILKNVIRESYLKL